MDEGSLKVLSRVSTSFASVLLYPDKSAPSYDPGNISSLGSDTSVALENIMQKKDRRTIESVIETEAYCFDLEKFSEKFVEAIFIEAKKRITGKREQLITVFDIVQPVVNEMVNDCLTTKPEGHQHSTNCGSKNIMTTVAIGPTVTVEWPKISEFTIKLGLEKVEEFVTTWERLSDWLYCVEFLGFESEDCSNVFVFEVEWSKPTNAYPVPQVTASVYFALDVFKMVPHNWDRQVDVTYVFEASYLIHSPGRIDFQEKWLQDIIDAKLGFFKTITFGVPKGFCSFADPIPAFSTEAFRKT